MFSRAVNLGLFCGLLRDLINRLTESVTGFFKLDVVFSCEVVVFVIHQVVTADVSVGTRLDTTNCLGVSTLLKQVGEAALRLQVFLNRSRATQLHHRSDLAILGLVNGENTRLNC